MFSHPSGKVFILFYSSLLVAVTLSCGTVANVSVEETATAWYNLGNAYTELGRNEEAVEAFVRARELDPSLFSAGYNLARVYIYLENYDDSIDELQGLLEVDPENRIAKETLAWVYHLQGDDEKALDVYLELISQSQFSRNSLYNVAAIYDAQGEKEKAVQYYETLVDNFPQETTVYRNLAILSNEALDYDKALLWSAKYTESAEDEYQSWELNGDILKNLSRYDDALDSFLKAEQLAEKNSEKGRVIYKQARIYLTIIDDSEKGLELLKKAVENEWKDIDAAEDLLSDEELPWYEDAAEILKTVISQKEKTEVSEAAAEEE